MTPEPACRPTKPCTTCGETKPLDAFPLDKATPGGRRATCKDCSNKARRLSRARKKKDRPQHACTFTGCKRVAHTDGLCERHHAYLTACRESPLALTGGEWVVGPGGVRRWVA